MRIKFPHKAVNGVTAYAYAPSSSDRSKKYLVVKQKTVDGGVAFRCGCEGYMFRGEACKHIKEFKEAFAAITHRR